MKKEENTQEDNYCTSRFRVQPRTKRIHILTTTTVMKLGKNNTRESKL